MYINSLCSVEDESKVVNAVVHGIIMNIEMPFPLPNPDACQNCGITCPLSKSTEYKYVATLPVLKSYPKVTKNYPLYIVFRLKKIA